MVPSGPGWRKRHAHCRRGLDAHCLRAGTGQVPLAGPDSGANYCKQHGEAEAKAHALDPEGLSEGFCGALPGARTKARQTSASTRQVISAAPASIAHHKVAMSAAAGPCGESVDSGPRRRQGREP
ncbi:hypothetical protein V6L77_07015 [Pannonibacter sp. Pt2-lr]